MNIRKKLEEMAMDSGLNFFGVAPVDRFSNAPAGHRPTDLLPGARSGISVGIKIPKGCLAANHRAYEGLRHGIFSYMLFGYNLLNGILDNGLLRLLRFIESDAGGIGYPIPASIPRDEEKLMGAMSNRHAAVCAGLAEFGWNGLAMRPDTGPRVRWGTLITDKEIEPNPLPDISGVCTNCKWCVQVCPMQAISEDQGVELSIGGKVFRYAVLNKMRCRCGVSGFTRSTAGRTDLEIPEKMTAEEWLAVARNDNVWNKIERIASMCGRCMITCKAGE